LVAESEDGRARVIDLHLGKATPWETVAAIEGRPRAVPQAPMVTLRIDAGRTDKLRPGDIVGALTGDVGLKKEAIGKIDVFATRSYVAIAHPQAGQTLEKLRNGKIKGRKLRVHRL
jgi:ATP-independent RNA helicase DbpA